jgi:hypothetical protein
MSQEKHPERLQIGDAVLYQTLDDEVVLLNMANHQYYGLNDVGSQMWKLLLELPDVTSVAKHLTADYNVDETVVRSDLDRLLGNLLDQGLLKPR